jgi:ribosomal-protein-alanine N-acetyltransferase
MSSVDLVRLDPALEDALATHPQYLKALFQGDWEQAAAVVHELIGRTLASVPVSVDTLQWGGYFAVDTTSHEVVGSCAFKTPPTEEGTVEIAYFTYPEFGGRGYATGMARKLIELASASDAVRRIIAHTLPEPNASTRVLEKAGMSFVGEVFEPDDGRVWRWQVQATKEQELPLGAAG